MATTVGSHSVSAFATPVNGGPLDANVVRGNDNTIRTAYVAHDADTGIHVQSSTLASRPSAGTAGRKWITADTGVYKLWYDDGTTWHEVAAGNIDVFVIADESLVKGDVVKITGYNNGTGAPTVAKIASASDTAFGIVNSTTIANGATGYVTNTGLILDVDTQAFSIGNILYPNTSGGLTATKPTSGNYQPVAYVLRSNQNNGVLYVEFSAPRIVERSDNTASTVVLRDASGNFSAGTITAGAVTSTGLVTFASLKGTGATTVTNILDEDTMSSDSATALATQQSIKAYVDAKVATVDTLAEVLANGNTTGANNIIVTAGQKITTNTIDETTAGSGVTIDSVLLKDDVVNATDIETGTISANDGTASATIANSTGVMTIASSVLTTTDINGGTIDGTTIGGASAAAGTFTTVGATTGNITTVNATTVDTTSIEVTNVKAKDGTASITIADSTGVATISAAPVLSALTASQAVFTDASKGLVSNAITGTGNVVMSASPTLTGTVTAATLNATTLGGTLSTAAQTNITSVGTLTSLTVSGASTFNGLITRTGSAATGTQGLTFGGTTTAFHYANFANTGASFVIGIEGSSGNQLFTGSAAYSAGIKTGNATNLCFGTNDTTRMTLDASGNLGLGVTPSAWGSTFKPIQLGQSTYISGRTNANALYVGTNGFWNGSADIYIVDGFASSYEQGSGVHTWKTAGSGLAGNSISYTTAMTLDASGNLGVGTASPLARVTVVGGPTDTGGQYNLVVQGTSSPATITSALSAGTLELFGGGLASGSARGGQIDFVGGSASSNAGTLIFRTGTAIGGTAQTERARITAGGFFKASDAGTYLNATGPYHELRSSINNGTLIVTNTNGSYTDDLIYGNTTTAAGTGFKLMRLDANSVEQFRVRGDGTIFAQNTTVQSLSDVRLKENISDAAEGLAVITALRPVRYDWKPGYGNDRKNQLGFIAQEMEAVFPEAVSEWSMNESTGEVDEDGKPITEQVAYKTVGPGALIPVLVKAIQELEARIAALEA